jgi:2-isopropylmalate synthase
MLKHEETYEIMRPETVGLQQSSLVLGKHSGRHALRVRLAELGYEIEGEELKRIFARFKEVADKKKTISDADLQALMVDERYQPREIYQLGGLQVACGTMGMPTATVRLVGPDGQEHVEAAVGTGPVDATYKAIDAIVQAPNTLLEFAVRAVTRGIDAIGEVTVRLQADNGRAHQRTSPQSGRQQARTFGGYGAHAYLAALNKLLVASGRYDDAEAPPANVAQPLASAAELPAA